MKWLPTTLAAATALILPAMATAQRNVVPSEVAEVRFEQRLGERLRLASGELQRDRLPGHRSSPTARPAAPR